MNIKTVGFMALATVVGFGTGIMAAGSSSGGSFGSISIRDKLYMPHAVLGNSGVTCVQSMARNPSSKGFALKVTVLDHNAGTKEEFPDLTLGEFKRTTEEHCPMNLGMEDIWGE